MEKSVRKQQPRSMRITCENNIRWIIAILGYKTRRWIELAKTTSNGRF
jgi:hypothetical protein